MFALNVSACWICTFQSITSTLVAIFHGFFLTAQANNDKKQGERVFFTASGWNQTLASAASTQPLYISSKMLFQHIGDLQHLSWRFGLSFTHTHLEQLWVPCLAQGHLNRSNSWHGWVSASSTACICICVHHIVKLPQCSYNCSQHVSCTESRDQGNVHSCNVSFSMLITPFD